jgi:hypothetical protein
LAGRKAKINERLLCTGGLTNEKGVSQSKPIKRLPRKPNARILGLLFFPAKCMSMLEIDMLMANSLNDSI